jgi:CBS domain-containing protein
MTMKSSVRDIMSTHVVAVHANASFKEMAARLREYHVSAFPVVDDDGTVIGIVSEADMLLKLAIEEEVPGAPGMIAGILQHRDQEKAAAVTAADLMTRPAVTVRPEDTVEHAARLMYARRVKRLPVTDPAGHLVGIISRADVLSVYNRPDEEIRGEIVNEVIPDELLMDPGRFTVTVKDGIVTLEGTPETAVAGRELADRVRHVQGVVSVRDRLSDPPADPSSPPPLS